MDGKIAEVIRRAVDDASRYPFLFVGSGLSRRYTGSPNWEGLLEKVCERVVDDKFAFSGYRSRAKAALHGGEAGSVLPYIATLLEQDADAELLKGKDFGEFRNKHEHDILSGVSPTKLLIADILSSYTIGENSEIALLEKAGKSHISGVITTNYDELCERLFPSFVTYVGEGDLLLAEQCFSQEIYKIHGSISSPGSLVLTSTDYDGFNEKRKYLAAKLLTIFMEYPVLFLGYSIQDENIKAILSDISACMPADKLDRLRSRLIFVQHAKETRVSAHSMAFGDKMLSMTSIETDDFSSIYSALLSTRKMYSTKLIRELRGSVFSLAEHIDPSSEIVVSGIDNVLNNLHPEQKIVIGLSMSPAGVGKPIDPDDIFEDVVLDNLHYDPKFIVENYLNRFVRQNPNGVPVFKYIRDLGTDEIGKYVANYASGIETVDSFRNKTIKSHMASTRNRFKDSLSVAGLVEACRPKPAFSFIPSLDEDDIDVDELEAALKDAFVTTAGDADKKRELLKDSQFRKCVMIYDYMRYGKRKSPYLCQ